LGASLLGAQLARNLIRFLGRPNKSPFDDARGWRTAAVLDNWQNVQSRHGIVRTRLRSVVSALDAAARVLATAGEPMGCKELIDVMAVKGLWKLPGGQTPWATLHSAIAREITEKPSAASLP